MAYLFSNTSKERLATCHPDLILIMEEAIKASPVDFGISEGHRGIERQGRLYLAGKSKFDGIRRKSKHNSFPSMACDFYPWVNGRAEWDNETLSYLAGLIHGIAHYLYRQGKIGHLVRWGGNWDQDGEIITDQLFDDRPHIELVEPKQ